MQPQKQLRETMQREASSRECAGDITQNICISEENAKRLKECDLQEKCLCSFTVQCCKKIKLVRERYSSCTLVLYSSGQKLEIKQDTAIQRKEIRKTGTG